MKWAARMLVLCFAIHCSLAALLAQGSAPQGEAELLAEFDRLQVAVDRLDGEQRSVAWLQLSDAFLRLPEGAERTARLPVGAAATLQAGRVALALRLATPKGSAPAQAMLLAVQLQALSQSNKLTEFARVIQRTWPTQKKYAAYALRREEGRLLPMAAAALRTSNRPTGRYIFELLAKLQPYKSYRSANLGLCLRQIGDVAQALAVYEAGLQQAPSDLELWNDYGLLLRATGRSEEAMASFRRSVALDLQRDETLRGKGPAITNLMHTESLRPGPTIDDVIQTACLALRQRPNATMLRRLMLDVTLNRLLDQ
jgi:tetratricopeptide (TPR) repeat protein